MTVRLGVLIGERTDLPLPCLFTDAEETQVRVR